MDFFDDSYMNGFCQRASRATALGLRGGSIIVPREVLLRQKNSRSSYKSVMKGVHSHETVVGANHKAGNIRANEKRCY